MRQSLLARFARRSVRQGQVGQTIVIMAFGFIILLAFVGIVTDVSLMFVRYSTLRRAVDAAAVAAAGQIRRTLPTQAELTQAKLVNLANYQNVANGYAFARNLTNINLAARQFIEFYGISPSNVWVRTCATDPDDVGLECSNTQQPRKLVRVTAQLASPTVFLRLIGWGTVTLEASSISETAVLDVVMMFDAAETMLKQTTYDDWKTVPITDSNGNLTYKSDGVTLDTKDQSLRYLPVKVNRGNANWTNNGALWTYWPSAADSSGVKNYITMWQKLLTMTQDQIYNDQTYFPEVPFTWDGTTATAVSRTDSRAPRLDCRVRFFPFAESLGPNAMRWPNATIPTDLQDSYTKLLQAKGTLSAGTTYDQGMNSFDGFMPAYNYFGCCNDPNGDLKFDDLICQPFKKVRDATEKFLDHLDFVRGDRVAFVTFDRSAYLIDPDGNGPQTAMITAQDNAVSALRRLVGVRAEPNFYADTNVDGQWDYYVTGGTAYNGSATGGSPIDYSKRLDVATNTWHNGGVANDIAGYNNTALGALNDYPVAYNCFFQNATLTYPFSSSSSEPGASNYTTYGAQLPYTYDATKPINDARFPTPLSAMSGAIMNPPLNDPSWNSTMTGIWPSPNKVYARQVAKATFSYEYRAGCGGNNIGGALRVGNNALLDPLTARTGNSGAVWVMVLLGDGAAGASDPVVRNGAQLSNADPYMKKFSDAPKAGIYGGYGLCPYGTADDQMGLTAGWVSLAPRCSDDGSEPSNGGKRGLMGPTSRHFCQDTAVAGTNNDTTLDLGKGDANCVNKYDVDDWARDWADFIGLDQPPAMSPFGQLPSVKQQQIGKAQLPTIFTIGFGLDFPDDPAKTCSETSASLSTNITDCLGEELLRYIADVGDNNVIDSDYQQDWVNDGQLNGITADSLVQNEGYGDRGPCEGPIVVSSGSGSVSYNTAKDAAAAGVFSGGYTPLRLNPLPPTENCGNYYNAPDGSKLTKVFEDIASRMFVRITK